MWNHASFVSIRTVGYRYACHEGCRKLRIPWYMVYAMATFAFYSLTTSIISYVKMRKNGDVVAITNSRVNLAIALASIFAVEIALLTVFGTAEDAQLRFIMPILTGTGIAITIVFLGTRSILGLDGNGASV